MLVRNFLEKYPDRGFHMMTPGRYVDLPPKQSGEGAKRQEVVMC